MDHRAIYSQSPGFSLVEESDQFIVFDSEHLEVCRLNESAAVIFSLCNGRRSRGQIASLLFNIYPDADPKEVLLNIEITLTNLLSCQVIFEQHAEKIKRDTGDELGNENLMVRRNQVCSQVFVFFRGANDGLFLEPLKFLVGAGVHDRNLILLRDPHQAYYFHGTDPMPGNLGSFLQQLKELIASMPGVTELNFVGTSKGAYTALLAGNRLKVDRVYSFGLSHSSLLHNTHLCNRLRKTSAFVNEIDLDLRELLGHGNGHTSYSLYFCEGYNEDRSAAEQLSGLDSVELHPQPGSDHNVVKSLEEQGLVGSLFPPFQNVAS